MTPLARRSSLILPVNIPRFVERAYTRHADGIVLDLEDSVPAAEKAGARKLVRPSIPLAARGGAEVAVRVNNEPGLLDDDIDAAVHPGLDNLHIPKAESSEQIREIAARVDRLERARGMELLYAVAHVVTICKAAGIEPTGLVGSIAGFRDLPTFEGAAVRARQLGCLGAGCIHPDQVLVLNRVFTPDPAKVEYARRVVEAFDEGVKQGTASVNLDGKMVDVPVYKRALVILERANAVAATERRKTEALARLG